MISQLASDETDSGLSLAPAALEGRSVAAALDPLWVGGVAVLCLALGTLAAPLLAPFVTRAVAWAPYLALGSLFPVLTALTVFWQRRGGALPAPLIVALISLPVLAAAIAAGPLTVLVAVGLAALQTVICVTVAARREPFTTARTLAMFVFAFVAWVAALERYTWDEMLLTLPPTWLLLFVGVLALFAGCWWAFGSDGAASRIPRQAQIAIDGVAVFVLILLAFRTDGLFVDRFGTGGTFYHWGAMTGPAEVVRAGGWLLWDVPSPYGFLTTLSMAFLPVSSSWQALYLLSAVASAALAIWLYFTIRALQPRPAGSLFALAVSAATVFLISSYAINLAPIHYFPMAGAFRYGWVYILIGILLLEQMAIPGSRRQHLVLLAGSACWLLSMLWSAESAFYGSAAWLPAFALIVLRDHGGFGQPRSWRRLLAWLLVPALLLAAALAIVIAVYQQALGHLPDALSYVEVLISFGGSEIAELPGRGSELEILGPIATVIFGCVLLATAAAAIARSNIGPRDLPVVVGLAYGLWGLLSYPIGARSNNSSFRLMPCLVLGLAIVLAVIAPRYRALADRQWIDFVKTGSVSLLTVLLTLTYANVDELRYYADAVRIEPFRGADVTAGIPLVEPALADLLRQANVAASDPIFYAGGEHGVPMSAWAPAGETAPVALSNQWLTGPLIDLGLRPEERKQTYLRRATERRPESGWLIERQNSDGLLYPIAPWFFEQVNVTHVPTRFLANDAWRLTWYELRGSAEGELRPLPGAISPESAPDLWINGEASSADPDLWGFFGGEWSGPPAGQALRCADGSGSLYVFSREARQARLILGFPEPELDGALHVALNGGAPVATEPTRTGKQAASLALQPGWNTAAIELTSPDSKTSAAAPAPDGCLPNAPDARVLQVDYFEIRTRD